MKQDCCHRLTIKTSYIQCRAVIEDRLTPFVRYNRNSLVQKRRFDGIVDSLLTSMRQTSSVVGLRRVNKPQPPVLQKINSFVQSKVAEVLKRTNNTGKFNNITINVYNNTRNVTGSVIARDKEPFQIPTTSTSKEKDGFRFHKESKAIRGSKMENNIDSSKVVHKKVGEAEQKPPVIDKSNIQEQAIQQKAPVTQTNEQTQPITEKKEAIKTVTPPTKTVQQTKVVQNQNAAVTNQTQNKQTIQSNQTVQTQNNQTVQTQNKQVKVKKSGSSSDSNESKEKEKIEVVKKAPGADVRGNMARLSAVNHENSVKDAKKEVADKPVVDGTTQAQGDNMAINENKVKDKAKKESSSSSQEDSPKRRARKAKKVSDDHSKEKESKQVENKEDTKDDKTKSMLRITAGVVFTIVALAV